MNFFKKYTTPFGYIADGNKIDAYGVDHSGFSTRDEVEYQFARQERESQLADNLNQQGIKEENYPKLGTSFWGNNPENNYGFGSSNIHDNIENRNNNSFENTFDSLGQEQSKINQSQHIENMNQFSTAFPSRYKMNDLIDKLRQYQENALNMNNSSINKGSILNSDDIKRLNLNASSVLFPQQNSFSPHSQSYQLAQNTTPNTMSDVGNISSGNFSPEVFKERMLPVIRNMEQPLDYIYIDTTWNKTTGAGANVDDWDTFNQINWMVNGRQATEAEKRAAFDYFDAITSKGKQNVDEEGNLIKKNNNQADFYRDKSQLKVSSAEIDRLLRNHITEDIKYLQKEFPDFASYPPELQNVLLDIKFNTGNVSQENWPKLRKAIAEKNLFGKEGIIHNVHRKDVGEDRNYWAEQQIRNIKSW